MLAHLKGFHKVDKVQNVDNVDNVDNVRQSDVITGNSWQNLKIVSDLLTL